MSGFWKAFDPLFELFPINKQKSWIMQINCRYLLVNYQINSNEGTLRNYCFVKLKIRADKTGLVQNELEPFHKIKKAKLYKNTHLTMYIIFLLR